MDISAQVILRAQGPMTVATLVANQPPEAAVQAVRGVFHQAGFALGPYVGISFSISGPASLFESYFRIRLATLQSGELPLGVLPPLVAGVIDAVAFTPPPDFGPSGSGP